MSIQTGISNPITATNLAPPPVKIPMYDKNGILAPQWLYWWQQLWNRVGAATGQTIYNAANTVNIVDTTNSGQYQIVFAPGPGEQSQLEASTGLKFDPSSGTLYVNSIDVNTITGGATIVVTSVEQANNANLAILATNVTNPNPTVNYQTLSHNFHL